MPAGRRLSPASILIATVWMPTVAFFALPFLWRHWDDPRSRAESASAEGP